MKYKDSNFRKEWVEFNDPTSSRIDVMMHGSWFEISMTAKAGYLDRPCKSCDHPSEKKNAFCPTCGKPTRTTPRKMVAEYIAQKKAQNNERFQGIQPDGQPFDIEFWHSHEEDMSRLSESFPRISFSLEIRPIGKLKHYKHFSNGKIRRLIPEITYRKSDWESFDAE